MSEAGIPRAARPNELASVAELADKVFRPGNPVTMGHLFPTLWDNDNAGNVRVISDENGRIVSHIGLWPSEVVICGTRIKSASMGGVCSDESIRGKGYGTALLMDAFEHCRNNGIDIITISGGRGLYRRNECREVGVLHSYTFSPEQAMGLASGLGTAGHGLLILSASDSEIPAMAHLYGCESIRFSRTLSDFSKSVRAKTYAGVYNQEQIILTAKRAGEYVAYLAVKRVTDSESGELTCFEYAGDTCAVVAMISELAKEYPSALVTLKVPGWDTRMTGLLKTCTAPPPEAWTIPGTHFITVPGRLFRGLRRYFEERVGNDEARELSEVQETEDGRGIVLNVMGQTEVFGSRAEVIDLVFGTPEMEERLGKLSGPLGEALKTVFPLPFPNPEGITYI